MEWDAVIEKELSFGNISVSAAHVGEDLLLCVQGGEKPHIGCAVLAVPRLSLSGDGRRSATSSVLNLTGHKDEAICRRLAESACKRTERTVACTGGFHMDDITKEQISEVLGAVEELAEELAGALGTERTD